jgi:threonine aldolase
MDQPTLDRLAATGWFVYRFIDGTVRFMCSWATTPEMVDELGEALKAVAEGAGNAAVVSPQPERPG